MTFLFLPVFNLFLLLYPHPLSYDWSMDAVSRIEKLSDPRNCLTLVFYVSLFRRIYQSALKINASLTPDIDFKPSPIKISCKICRFSIANQKCSNNNSIVIPCQFEDGQKNGSGGGGASITNGGHHIQQASPHQHTTLSTPISKTTFRNGVILGSPKNGGPSSSGGRGSSQSVSPQRHTTHKSWSGPVWHSSSGSLEHGALLLQLAFLVLPFLPASNIFLYVGFVGK